ncbi:bifunctional diaminohydroxyphosphoribosylaminopyrimidine deaminase/5-amino-6-(5-phosphoribosylamino)uracil reductase RibD [Liquorilactobacillus capillatus]|uniref:Riboflavin biosynthesis protein RibD n=1 Tax=Liquorilactobacillus capillatus DSM 19910 TaxID=1423731 RepID=A0A0R1MDP9_9LACO|nr:bifunctional diaminohydroxyphosphoribosylaminopyrimidine deaminase/5-amino-6-(5-phosphoribosylamino)uracil reductase RibD [Liquorilactobacillus capillatus]KRL02427.1 diaminohydroxyphosphoribosylaminopyrimidine deaminase 5-amino-6-(5-phosphoribosylamino)uracil reductase [Liquorilactobacillus capillatus DSM 19910]
MKTALVEAEKGRYQTYTNPMVGAVIVKENQLIGLGHHAAFGKEHAEINAFNNVVQQEKIKGAIMFVTLEPCSHFGKTPPCCREIVRRGIKEIYIAQKDPNPLVAGQGIAYLEKHGVRVHVGILAAAAQKLNRFYNFFYLHDYPFITLKTAQTLDGRISLTASHRTYLTDELVFNDVQQLRADYQAILVGSGTILADNPLLTVRMMNLKYPPVRIIIDRRGRLINTYKVINNDAPTWIFTENMKMSQYFTNSEVEIFFKKKWTLKEVMQRLAQAKIQSVLVEGGARMQDAFLERGLFQELLVYQTNQLAGGNSLAAFQSKRSPQKLLDLKIVERRQVGNASRLWLRR